VAQGFYGIMVVPQQQGDYMLGLDLASTCLAYVLFGEAGDNFINQAAVYNVVMNRAEKIDKVCDVVYAPQQFEYISLVQQGKMREPNRKELLENKIIAIKFLTKQNGYTYNPIGKAKFFHDNRISVKRNVFNRPLLAQVNNLYFY
jgi:spore germination cell wall hydrolase CwlJ-like protein